MSLAGMSKYNKFNFLFILPAHIFAKQLTAYRF